MFAILQSESDVFSLGIARNSERENKYKWVGPIYKRKFVAYKLRSRADVVASSIDDIK